MKQRFIFIVLLMAMVAGTPAHAAVTVLTSGFEGSGWNEDWDGSWIQGTDQSQTGSASAKANALAGGMFTSKSLNTSSAQSITVDFRFRKDDTDVGNDFLLYYYNGSRYNLIADLDTLGGDDTWLHFTDTITDPQYMNTDFRIRFEARALTGFLTYMVENVWVDQVTVSMETQAAVDSDGDGYPVGEDCDDTNASIHPGATDTCNDGIDQDCDGQDAVCSVDGDGDGYPADQDCNDADSSVYPGATDICDDGIDQNCDGRDEACGGATILLTSRFEGYDWNESWSGSWIQGTDQAHDGSASAKADASAGGMFTSRSLNTSSAQSITIDFRFRKDDTDPGGDFLLYYFNGTSYNLIADLDTLGGDDTWLHYSDTITDPQYMNPDFRIRFEARALTGFYTYMVENVWVDNVTVSMETQTAVDSDNDGYAAGEDCNDNDASIHPGATDTCNDGIDQDCDGRDAVCVVDNDSDGYAAGEDCNDNDASIHPGATDTCNDGIDQDCDGRDAVCVVDNDSDGYAAGEDCNDNDASIHPGATDTCNDGIDQDCDGRDATCVVDEDNDGYPVGQDCDDTNAHIHPGAVDFCGDHIDQDCDGSDTTCIGAPSCISNLDSWKLKYRPTGNSCTSCHTTCTPGGHGSRCTEGGPWGSMNCTGCHRNQH